MGCLSAPGVKGGFLELPVCAWRKGELYTKQAGVPLGPETLNNYKLSSAQSWKETRVALSSYTARWGTETRGYLRSHASCAGLGDLVQLSSYPSLSFPPWVTEEEHLS